MPFSCFLGGLGQQNGRKGVLKPPHLLTNYVCNRRVTAIVSRQRARPPTYLPQHVLRLRIWKLHVRKDIYGEGSL